MPAFKIAKEAILVSQGGAVCQTIESFNCLLEIYIIILLSVCWVLINDIFPFPSPYGFGVGGGGGGGGGDVVIPPPESQADI